MSFLWERLLADPAAAVQDRASIILGVPVPFVACVLLLVAAYAALAAAGLRILQGVRVGSALRLASRPCMQVAILGPSGAGKTCCLLALRNGKTESTVPSLAENRCDLTLRSVASAAAAAPKDEGEAPLASSQDEIVVRIVDSPGSQRLRRQAIANAAASSLIVFIVDAADKPSLKQAAEFLFELFCNPTIYSAKTPLLLVANKRDRPEARGLQAIIEDVEREIERCRVSRQAALEAEDVAASFIGAEGRRFLLEDAPSPLTVCSAAVATGDLSLIPSFIINHAT
ncbi:signal recognition particle receptor beta subunit protein [Cyclospora cayetanensis]|uniref:Signal recognition particle receptor subunit beta n=1 Tax=Cyclospora cayetanensis TaxID=88456 RepID=A0A1D3D5I0_9EIME|nr:signal recognition particle receptor beta subunit protein [Cyclospora cayetanensis]